MSKIKLKKILKRKEEVALIEKIIQTTCDQVIIMDDKDVLFQTTDFSNNHGSTYNIIVDGDAIGYVKGGIAAELVADLLTYISNAELEKKKMAVEILEKYRELMLLYNISEKIVSSFDVLELSKIAVEEAVKNINVTFASIMLYRESTGKLETIYSNSNDKDNKRNNITPYNVILQEVFKSGKAEIVNNILRDERCNKKDAKIGSLICAPLVVRDKVKGVFCIGHKDSISYTSNNLKLFKAIVFQISIAIENSELYNKVEEAFMETVKTLAETVEMRDPYTGGHTHRVMHYSMIIGKGMHLSKNQLNNLMLASLMHDIGKIGISDNILLKPGKLTDEEFEKMKKHSQYGADILKNIKYLNDIIPGVKEHHERFDGKGYPVGLKGEDIAIIGRILAVADSYDAMTTDRPYRKALDEKTAIKELQKEAGKQFDPQVVDVFIKQLQQNDLKEIDMEKLYEELFKE